MEMLDVVDKQGNPTGETVGRERAHREGILHRTSHVWILRMHRGRRQILLQKRCKTKDSHPGCYDISSAGHIPAGMGFLESAVRELKEELGVEAREEELIYCGTRQIDWEGAFYGNPFLDHQISNVYVLVRDLEEKDFALQESEIESVMWMDFEDCMEAVKKNAIPHCIVPEELQMVASCFPFILP